MTTTQTQNTAPSVDAVFERATEASEQFVTTARKAGNFYLDSYEKAVDRAIDVELKLAGATQQEWLHNMIETHTEFARELATSYTSSARALLK
jgi:hypothetical protein